MVLSILLMAAQTEKAPEPFYTAVERWHCAFKSLTDNDAMEQNFGVYRSHVADDGVGNYSIIQNDASALVFAFSDMGNTDTAGQTRKWANINIIDKRSRKFKKTIVDVDEGPSETSGRCVPY